MRKRNPTVLGAVIVFLTVAALTTVTVVSYALMDGASGGNKALIAGVMFGIIFVISALFTLIDFYRRKYTVDNPVQKILAATEKIATGDFSVRLEITHTANRYDEFDYIMENLNKMAVELSHTEVLHTDFISNVSHELKTPIAVILNYASSLQKPDLDAATRAKYAQTVASAANRLTALITNILKLNKLENQGIKPEYEVIDLSENLAETVIAFEDIIEEKELNLSCDFEEGVKVKSIKSYLETVWNNLLSNAIKFTEGGGAVSVTLKKRNGLAVVEISDTGCGISADTGKHIFEKFYQGDTSHSQEGNGLGLALVKKVIDITGGTVAVDSEVGKGTTFTVSFKAYESD